MNSFSFPDNETGINSLNATVSGSLHQSTESTLYKHNKYKV